jgi:hypothetical protein
MTNCEHDEQRKPLTLNLVVQLAGMHPPHNPDGTFTGDLSLAAEQFCRYFVEQLKRLAEPRGADLVVVVSLHRGDAGAGHRYGDGRFADPATNDQPSP